MTDNFGLYIEYFTATENVYGLVAGLRYRIYDADTVRPYVMTLAGRAILTKDKKAIAFVEE